MIYEDIGFKKISYVLRREWLTSETIHNLNMTSQ